MCWRWKGGGVGDPGWSFSLQRPGKSSSVNRGACWRGGKQKGSSSSQRSRGGLRTQGSRALTSDPGSSPRSPSAARPLFTQDPSRGPRSCRARVLLNPPFPDFHPLPLPPAPGEDSPAGNPRPTPTPRVPAEEAAVGASGAGSAEPASPAGPGLRGRGGERGGKGRRGGGVPGGPAPLPGRGLDLLTAIGPPRPAPSPCPQQPRPFRGNVGRK